MVEKSTLADALWERYEGTWAAESSHISVRDVQLIPGEASAERENWMREVLQNVRSVEAVKVDLESWEVIFRLAKYCPLVIGKIASKWHWIGQKTLCLHHYLPSINA